MGIAWFVCRCGTKFDQTCFGYSVCDCGQKWCSVECATMGGLIINKETKARSCFFCRDEEFNDSELFEVAYRLGIDRNELIKKIKAMIGSDDA